MTKKEIQSALNNLPEVKYLYNRYNGEIRKYEVQDNILINVKNVNDIIDTDKHLLLGKTSEDKLDLLDVGDLVFDVGHRSLIFVPDGFLCRLHYSVSLLFGFFLCLFDDLVA